MGNQLLLNYCYGHKDSSMLLIPSTPVVNFINHDSENANAFIRWSNSSYHHSDWLKLSVDEIIQNRKSGLIFEFVTLRDISPGEEIYIDYGKRWDEAWNAHVSEWEPDTSAKEYISASELNKKYKDSVLRTSEEQVLNPYPTNVDTICYIANTQNQGTSMQGLLGEHYQWVLGVSYDSLKSWPCVILDRSKGNKDNEHGLYTAKVTWAHDETFVVSAMPRDAIAFADRKYTGDQFLQKAFRHEINLPDGIFPEEWMDLKKKRQSQDEGTCRLYMAESSIPNSGLGMYTAVDIHR
eukprot:11394177-Ditylum_brightwellii.AAC.1